MSLYDFDVVVAGAGPSGSIAAYHLAAAGWRVCVLEKSRIPRVKICAGGVSAKALRYLPFDISPVIERAMHGAWLSYDARHFFQVDTQAAGVMVRRDRFDQFLIQRARERGAHLCETRQLKTFTNTSDGVKVETTDGPLYARVLIGADGANSVVRRIGWPDHQTDMAFASEILVPIDGASNPLPQNLAWLDTGALQFGYGWVFPKSDHLNIGVYRWRKSPSNHSMQQALRKFTQQNAIDTQNANIMSAPIPIRAAARRLQRGNVILTGDAAGLGEALFGEGIYYALASGTLAARSVDAFLRGTAPLSTYNRAIKPLRRELLYARAMAHIVYRAPRAIFHGVLRHRLLNPLFTGLITGQISYRRTFFTIFFGLLLAAFPMRLKTWDNRPSTRKHG